MHTQSHMRTAPAVVAASLRLTLTLALAATLALMPGCLRKPPPAPPAPPKILSVHLEPPATLAGGFYNVEPGTLTVTVNASGADSVEFAFSPTGTGQTPQTAAMDEDGGDGWQFAWDVPDADIMMHLTITARSAGGEATEIIGLYHERAGSGGQIPLGGREALCLTKPAAARFSAKGLSGLPKYFVATAWLDETHLLGLTGTNPVVVDVDGGGWRALNVEAWWAVPDPASARIAYANEGGLYVTDAAGADGAGRLVVAAKGPSAAEAGGPPDGALWSPDGTRLLYWYVYEWNLDFFLVDAAGGEPRPVPATPEGYFLTEAAAWWDDDTIVFNTRAVRSTTGQQEYRSVGYRGDVAVYDITTGGLRLITANPDGTYWNVVQRAGDGRLVYWVGEPGTPVQGFGTMAVDGAGVAGLTTDPTAEAVSFAPDGRRWMERRLVSASGNKNVIIARHDGDGGAAEAWADIIYGERLEGPLWSPSGNRVAFSLNVNVGAPDGNPSYYTFVIDAR